MLQISTLFSVPESEIEIHAVRSQGAGGQHVNKVSSAIHLRFDINASSLPQPIKDGLMHLSDSRISEEGVITIKAQQYRSQEQNRIDALNRLRLLIKSVAVPPKHRQPTKPTKSSKQRRLQRKAKRGRLKALRGKVDE